MVCNALEWYRQNKKSIFSYRPVLSTLYMLEVKRHTKKTKDSCKIIHHKLGSSRIAMGMAMFTDSLREPRPAHNMLQSKRENAGADLKEISNVRDSSRKLHEELENSNFDF